ncbi:Xaa-Pro aminopeptidase [Nannocystis pusilla]|uniref:Xaa-Pro aminopeptidase n=1 Tax=Nannocystis pusilla TaxID=889268 RepID=A0A9X3EIM1_9BACT|nr:Xaa-Pro aminopeptidase [Nannocystis pusilla]MCY1004381.1 Xaa-Pro aminopeptidase [Nannocystis pusilla]
MRRAIHCEAALLVACACTVGGRGAVDAVPRAAEPAVELYGAGHFTTGAWDFFMAFSPDQRQVLFGRADPAFDHYEILETRLGVDGRWSKPAHPSFAGQWSDADPHISPAGDAVYFISNRPIGSDEPGPRATYDIWFAPRASDGSWAPAQRVPEPVNDAAVDEWSPAIAASGNLYFGIERPGGHGGTDLWLARRIDGVYQPPENLGPAINTPGLEVEPWIAPDESYLIFAGLRRADSVGSYDLYFSRRRDGAWEPARPLASLNTAASEWNHSVSPDGAWLYFSSNRRYSGPLGPRFDEPRDDRSVAGVGDGKQGDIYRVSMRALGLP